MTQQNAAVDTLNQRTMRESVLEYHAIVAEGFGNSGVGVPGGPVQFSVPGPVVGAGLPAFLVALGGLVGLHRRRRKLVA